MCFGSTCSVCGPRIPSVSHAFATSLCRAFVFSLRKSLNLEAQRPVPCGCRSSTRSLQEMLCAVWCSGDTAARRAWSVVLTPPGPNFACAEDLRCGSQVYEPFFIPHFSPQCRLRRRSLPLVPFSIGAQRLRREADASRGTADTGGSGNCLDVAVSRTLRLIARNLHLQSGFGACFWPDQFWTNPF